jgi:hypothetical protein
MSRIIFIDTGLASCLLASASRCWIKTGLGDLLTYEDRPLSNRPPYYSEDIMHIPSISPSL